MKIAVIGSGGWGTALAALLRKNGHQVSLWSYHASESQLLRQTGESPFLKGVPLPEGIGYTTDPACVKGQDMVVMATPSFAVRATAQAVAPHLDGGSLLVSVTKGIEAETNLRMSQVLEEVTGKKAAVLSGPSHAEEVIREVPTGCVAACREEAAAKAVQDVFMNGFFRVYTSPDVIGVELGAAMKNVIALCAGVCDGLGFGDNTKALLMTRGLTEVARLGMALGGRMQTFAGLAGVGDLIVTCTSMHSRNRRAGILIGQGVPVQEAMKQVGAVVEGYYAAISGYQLAQKAGVEMPILHQAHQVLLEGKDPAKAMSELMSRGKKGEIEDVGWM